MIYLVLNAVIPSLIILALAIIAGKRKIADNININALSVFVVKYAIPAELFLYSWGTKISDFAHDIPFIIMISIGMIAVWFIGYFISKKILKQTPSQASMYALTLALPNVAAFSYPVLNGLFGKSIQVDLYAAIAIIMTVLVTPPLTLAVLEKENVKKYKSKNLLSLTVPLSFKVFRNPIILWPILGLILSALHIKEPQIAIHTLTPLGDAATGSAIFLTGLVVSARKFRITKGVILAFLTKNLGQSAIILAIGFLFHFPMQEIIYATLIGTLATGFFGVMLGKYYGVDNPEAESSLLFSTIFFGIATIIYIYILGVH
ncbi:MAG: AEC family transporter [Psittacicella sp.]